MRALREVGPTIVGSTALLLGIYGLTHAWPTRASMYALYFGGALCVTSLIVRAVTAVAPAVRRFI